MEDAEDRLKQQDHEQSDADDWVRVAHEVHMRSHVDTHRECNDIDEISEYLKGSVNPDQTSEVCETDQDATDWEKRDKGNGRKNPMGE